MGERFLQYLYKGESIITALVLLGLGLGVALVLRGVVTKAHRERLRVPMLLLAAGSGFMILFEWMPSNARLQRWTSVIPVALLLLAFGRLLSIAVFDWLLTRRLQTGAPRIVRDIVDGLFTGVSLLIALGALGVAPGSLLTTSAVLTAVLGLSLQDTLGNLFAGLALQMQRPFDVGDWIQIDRDGLQVGRVLELNWRAARLRTNDGQELIVPNNLLARSVILNHSIQDSTHCAVKVLLPYQVPTQRAHTVLLRAAEAVDGVLAEPKARVVTTGFADHGVQYELRFHIADFSRRSSTEAMVRDRVWYVLQRTGLTFATPPGAASATAQRADGSDQMARARAISKIDFLQGLPDGAIDMLAADSHIELYAPGEYIVRQGETGEELYLCLSGTLQVLHQTDNGELREVARLEAGGLFGEIAQLTGQARNASVRAATTCELLVLRKPAFVQVLKETPAFAEQISERLAQRRAELDALERVTPELTQANLAQHKRQFLQRIREFFLS
ncbi:MAG TPA: mechanosensitive ion channel family protein [Polyangiales bacterium]|nr:mechanosensitive ion channel family protein [Polyangiales bacterium]